MKDVVIVSACRTAIGKYGGAFKDVPAVDLGAVVIEEAIKRAGIAKDAVDEVVMGNVLQSGLGQNPARQAMIKAGMPVETPAMTTKSAVPVCVAYLWQHRLLKPAMPTLSLQAAWKTCLRHPISYKKLVGAIVWATASSLMK